MQALWSITVSIYPSVMTISEAKNKLIKYKCNRRLKLAAENVQEITIEKVHYNPTSDCLTLAV